MHELSIVMTIVDLAERSARQHQANAVKQIDLEIGALAGVELSALKFVWPEGVKGSVLENAKRVIHQIPGKGRCEDCNQEFALEQYYGPCPHCGSFAKQVIAGNEMRVRSLTVEGRE